MCGFTGIIGEYVQQRSLDITTLKHRGPDSSGIWSAPRGEFPASIGHNRLSILGLDESGNQPILSQDSRYVFVFNGEIYNFIELKTALEAKGYVFRSSTDTEVLLYGLIEEGASFMHRCNGMWAFCLWDRMLRTATFGRDRFGVKPLYYAELANGALAFASEMKALYPFLESVKPRSDIDLYIKHLFDYEHTENCVVEGIKRIPPGHWAQYNNGRLVVHRWWNTLDHVAEVPCRYEDQVEQWRELFLDSVRLRMRADVRIGTALSGGLDSSATFCAMAHIAQQSGEDSRQSNDWQHGFCAHFPGSSLDELKWAQLVTDFVGVPLESVNIDPSDCAWSIKEALYQVEDPYLTLALPMLATYQAISHSGIKVTLDGHGADELFSGYGHLMYATRSANPKQLAEILAIESSTRTGNYKPDYRHLRPRWLKYKVLNMAKNSYYPKKIVKLLLKKINSEEFHYQLKFNDENHPAFQAMDPFNQSLYEIFHVTILPTLLRNYDRYSMASGVEVRMPFMDWRLVTFTFSLPWESKLGGGFTKRIMRDALYNILPEPIRERRDKIGWNSPLHEWLQGSLKEQINSYLVNESCPPELYQAWSNFQKVSSPTFTDGQRMWENLLPYLWRFSLDC